MINQRNLWTVLLLRSDYAAATYGHDTILLHVEGATAKDAVDCAKVEAARIDEHVCPEAEDYYCLFCTPGHLKNYSDGAGGGVELTQERKITTRGWRTGKLSVCATPKRTARGFLEIQKPKSVR